MSECWRHGQRRANSSHAGKLSCGHAKYKRAKRQTRKSRRANRV